MSDVTHILSAIEQGDLRAAEKLLPLVYEELRRLATQRLAREAPGQSLQSSDLVHEAYLRLVGEGDQKQWDSRAHFFAAAAEAMRRILVENARRKKRLKHGGGRLRVELEAADFLAKEPSEDLEALDEALDQAGGGRPGEGRAGQAPLLRRPDHARDRPGAQDLAGNRRAPLDLRPHLALCRAQRPGRFREFVKRGGSSHVETTLWFYTHRAFGRHRDHLGFDCLALARGAGRTGGGAPRSAPTT